MSLDGEEKSPRLIPFHSAAFFAMPGLLVVHLNIGFGEELFLVSIFGAPYRFVFFPFHLGCGGKAAGFHSLNASITAAGCSRRNSLRNFELMLDGEENKYNYTASGCAASGRRDNPHA